jgi:hypothetical protein
MARNLREGEELRLQEKALYEHKPALVIVTDARVFVDCDGRVASEFPLASLKFKRSKATNARLDANTVVKLRMHDDQERIADVAFKGVTSEAVLARVLEAAKAAQKDLQSRLVDPDVGRPPPQLGLPEEDPRRRLIAEDRVVADMYRLLVESETITSEEFWDNFRTDLINRAVEPAPNELVLSRSFLGGESVATSPTEFRFRMARTTIARIFEKQPELQEQHRKWVSEHGSARYGGGLSPEDEQEFWRRCIRGSKPKEVDDRQMFDGLSRHREVQLDLIEGSRARPDEAPPDFRETISLLNLNSELVLSQADEREVPEETPGVEGDLGDAFVAGKRRGGEENPELEEASLAFLEEMGDYSAHFTELPAPPETSAEDAAGVLGELTESPDGGFNLSKLKTGDKSVTATLARLRKHKMEQQILLFHYWNNVENEDEASRQKVVRLLEKLADLRRICNNEIRGITSPMLGRLFAPLYQELNDAFGMVGGLAQ